MVKLAEIFFDKISRYTENIDHHQNQSELEEYLSGKNETRNEPRSPSINTQILIGWYLLQ